MSGDDSTTDGEWAKICCLRKNQMIQQKMRCVSKMLLSQQKCLVMLQQKMLSKQKLQKFAE